MRPLLVVILGVLIGIGVGALCDWHISRLCARDVERRAAKWRHEQDLLSTWHFRLLCARNGHKYTYCAEGWHCPICGDLVLIDRESGVA